MFDHASRYDQLETAKLTTARGRVVAYKRRRFLPQGEGLTLLAEIEVVQGDRLDLITHRTLGDPLDYWRVCDANNAMRPGDLTADPGARVRIPVPKL